MDSFEKKFNVRQQAMLSLLTKEKTGMTSFLDSAKHNMNIIENLFYTQGFSWPYSISTCRLKNTQYLFSLFANKELKNFLSFLLFFRLNTMWGDCNEQSYNRFVFLCCSVNEEFLLLQNQNFLPQTVCYWRITDSSFQLWLCWRAFMK